MEKENSAVEVLREFNTDLKELGKAYMQVESKENGKYIGRSSTSIDNLKKAIDEAVLALEKKEDDRKQGAIEELKGIINLLDKFGTERTPTLSMKRFFEKRLKELGELK